MQTNRTKDSLDIALSFFIALQDCVCGVMFTLSENEAENLQNGDVHLAEIPDFEMGYLENHLTH